MRVSPHRHLLEGALFLGLGEADRIVLPPFHKSMTITDEALKSAPFGPGITFRINFLASPDVRWIVKRSFDLISFTEIYRFDGPTSMNINAEGEELEVQNSAGRITVLDSSDDVSPKTFYRLETELVSP